jgi:hypothetical protein
MTLRRFALVPAALITAVCVTTVMASILPIAAWWLYRAGRFDSVTFYQVSHWQPPSAVQVLLPFAAGVAFIAWLHRARRNVAHLADAGRLIDAWWTTAMWMPFVNLYLPGLYLARLAEVSTEPGRHRPTRAGLRVLVWTWFGFWTISSLYSQLSLLHLSAPMVFGETMLWIPFSVSLSKLVAGPLVILLMFRIAAAQAYTLSMAQPAVDPADFPTFTVDDVVRSAKVMIVE